MKTNLIIAGLWCALSLPLCAQTASRAEFQIKKITNVAGQDPIGIGRDWRTDSPKRLKVTLRVGQPVVNTPEIIATATFYDKDNQIVETWETPHPVRKKELKGFKVLAPFPEKLEPGKDYQVYFALPPELNRKKWVRVTITFGRLTGEGHLQVFDGAKSSFP